VLRIRAEEALAVEVDEVGWSNASSTNADRSLQRSGSSSRSRTSACASAMRPAADFAHL
jgi:hypothetical protein